MKALILVASGTTRAMVEKILTKSNYQFRSCDNMQDAREVISSDKFDFAIVDVVFGRSHTFEIASSIPNDLPMLIFAESDMSVPRDHAYQMRIGWSWIIDEKESRNNKAMLIEDFIERLYHEQNMH